MTQRQPAEPPRRPQPRAPREPRESAPRPQRTRPASETPPVEPDINAEQVELAAHVLDDILRILRLDANLTIREPLTPGDGRGSALAVVDIEGEDLGLLIGRRGETLQALQYLLNLIVGRRFTTPGSITVDVEHYRHRREGQIVALAERMADRVRLTGNPITLEPMSAAERRLVHLALAEDPEVQTNSIGDDENRKVVISSRR